MLRAKLWMVGTPPVYRTKSTVVSLLYRPFMLSRENCSMNVMAAAKALNQQAQQENWHHFCDPTLSFSAPVYQNLLSLWRTKANGRAMPCRSDITPRDLKDVLRHIVLVEREHENFSRYRWRLAGSGVTEVLGTHTGKTFDECVPPNLLPRWVSSMNLILDSAQPLRFIGRVHISGREYLDAEHLYVPLANDNEVPTFIMGLCRYTPRQTDDEESWEHQIASIPGGLL